MKILYLNSVITVPSEKGEAKIAKALEKNGNKAKTDDYGRNLEWYEENQLKPPIELLDQDYSSEISEDGMMNLKRDEFEYDFVDYILKLEDFSSCIDDQEIGSYISTKNGNEVWIEESAEEIYAYITILTRPWYTVAIDNLKYYFQFLLRKIKCEKKLEINYEY